MGKHPKATPVALKLFCSVSGSQSVFTSSCRYAVQPYQQTRKYHKDLQYSLRIPEIGFAKIFDTLFHILPNSHF